LVYSRNLTRGRENLRKDIVHQHADAEMRSLLIQTVLNNILQLQIVSGLELALIAPRKRRKNNPKQNTEQ
jgi:hypothetical protein